jgi:C1A family cysteine protease
MKKNYTSCNFRLLFVAVVVSFLASCERSNVDPFDPTYDLGLIPAGPGDLVDGVTTLPNYFSGTLPVSFSLPMPPVGDQKHQGSCGAWSAGYAVMGYYINKSNSGNYSTNYLGSPKFLYNLAKGPGDCINTGTSYPGVLSVLKTKGICPLSDMPYNDNECTLLPNTNQYASAARYKIRTWIYLSLSEYDKMKRLLYSGYPLMIGIKIYNNFQTYKSGVYSTTTGNFLGNHAVCITGYDESRRAFKIQNSWGTLWGESGTMWISYDLLYQQVSNEGRCYLVVPNF